MINPRAYKIKIYKEILQELQKPNIENLLDIGCNDGSFVNFLARKTNKKIIGLDISDSKFFKAKRKATKIKVSHLIKCIKGDAHQMNFFKNEEFEAVTLLFTLHHLNNPKIALREIRRILKPNGKILIADLVVEKEMEKDGCYKLTIRDIRNMLKESEFENLDVKNIEPDCVFISAKKYQ